MSLFFCIDYLEVSLLYKLMYIFWNSKNTNYIFVIIYFSYDEKYQTQHTTRL